MPGRMLAAQCRQTNEQPLSERSKVDSSEGGLLQLMQRFFRISSMSSPGSSAAFDEVGMGAESEAISESGNALRRARVAIHTNCDFSGHYCSCRLEVVFSKA